MTWWRMAAESGRRRPRKTRWVRCQACKKPVRHSRAVPSGMFCFGGTHREMTPDELEMWSGVRPS